MATLTTAQFLAACQNVSVAARSLASCLASEIPNERLILAVALDELCHAKMARGSIKLLNARAAAINHANEIIARRGT